jgi:hypothetical protein
MRLGEEYNGFDRRRIAAYHRVKHLWRNKRRKKGEADAKRNNNFTFS